MIESFSLTPIGVFSSYEEERYDLPRQPDMKVCNEGTIRLNPHCNFEQALHDLESFDKIWVLFLFHKNPNWKPKVMPPRTGIKRGVFATRSPHRPNPIGMSCVDLVHVKGLQVRVKNHDLLDQTPILDIKPYIVSADSYPEASLGWLESLSGKEYSLEWEGRTYEQVQFLHAKQVPLYTYLKRVLRENPYPYPQRRIIQTGGNTFQMAYKTWRIDYQVCEEASSVSIQSITSAYDHETLIGQKNSLWQDVDLHRAFNAVFQEDDQ